MLDPLSLIMFGLIAVMIFFMFRNGKKRQAAMQELQNNMRPGAEVMLQSGIFATVESIDEDDNRVTVRSGNSTLVVHRNAIGQIVTPVEAPESGAESDIAPDDDPAFGARLNASNEAAAPEASETAADPKIELDTDEDKPKA